MLDKENFEFIKNIDDLVNKLHAYIPQKGDSKAKPKPTAVAKPVSAPRPLVRRGTAPCGNLHI